MAIRHVVQQGEGISSIADLYGFAPWTIWNDPQNAALRALRHDGDVLMPGDVVFVRDREEKVVVAATGAGHVFRRKGVPAKLRVQLFRNQAPRDREPFELFVDGAMLAQGETDANGVIEAFIPPRAKSGHVVVGADHRVVALAFGHLDPISEPSGVRKRLENLGFLRTAEASGTDVAEALAAFQDVSDLPVTGLADEATVRRLAQIHDGEGTFER